MKINGKSTLSLFDIIYWLVKYLINCIWIFVWQMMNIDSYQMYFINDKYWYFCHFKIFWVILFYKYATYQIKWTRSRLTLWNSPFPFRLHSVKFDSIPLFFAFLFFSRFIRWGSVFLWDSGSSTGTLSNQRKALNNCDMKQTRPYRLVTASEDFTVAFFEGPPFKFKSTLEVSFFLSV